MATDPWADRARRLTWLVVALGLLHLADHVLRVDHSGWPFRAIVTPFTYSLIVWPLLAFALWGGERRWARFWAITLVALGTVAVHLTLEPSGDKYAMWATGHSRLPGREHLANLLGLRSPGLGVASVALSMLLNVALVAAAFAHFQAARRSFPSPRPGL